MSDPGDIEEAYQETEAAALETSDPTYRPVFMLTNAITLSDKIQIVLRFYGEADAIHENYDFVRPEEHTSELQSLMRNSYAVFCLKKKKTITINKQTPHH